MKNISPKISAVLLACFLISAVLAFGQINEKRALANIVDQKCKEHICEAEESFSSFLNDGGLEHYISGCDSLYAFLSLYELSDNYQADNYLAIDEARLRLIVSKDHMTGEKINQLVEALKILGEDINAAPGYSALDIFINFELYSD